MAKAATARAADIGDNLRPPLVSVDQLRVDFAHVSAKIEELLADFAKMPPVLEDDDDLEQLIGTINKIKGYISRCDEIRVEETAPHLSAQRVLMGFFRDELGGQLADPLKQCEARTRAYLQKKREREAARLREAQAEADRLADEARKKAAEAIKQFDAKIEDVQQAVSHSSAMDAFAAKAATAAAAPSIDLTRAKSAAGSAGLQTYWDFEVEDLNTIDLELLRPFIKAAHIDAAMKEYVKAGRRTIRGARIFETDRLRTRAS